MPAYLVRLSEGEKNAREIVGIFVADCIAELCHLVDEVVDTDRCECFELPNGGIYWSRFMNHPVPRAVEPDWDIVPDDWQPLPPRPELTYRWSDALAADGPAASGTWEPVEWHSDTDEDDDEDDQEVVSLRIIRPVNDR